MPDQLIDLNDEVTKFLDNLKHPFRKEIEQLRVTILSANSELKENVKWNGPNYSFDYVDRITMRIQPPKQVQLIFHQGAKKKEELKDKLITDNSGLLNWKENDRAVATFGNLADIENRKPDLTRIVNDWLKTTS